MPGQVALREFRHNGGEIAHRILDGRREVVKARSDLTDEATLGLKLQPAREIAGLGCFDQCCDFRLAKQLVGTVLKDSTEDAKKVRQYFEVVVKNRAKRSEPWKSFYDARGILGG